MPKRPSFESFTMGLEKQGGNLQENQVFEHYFFPSNDIIKKIVKIQPPFKQNLERLIIEINFQFQKAHPQIKSHFFKMNRSWKDTKYPIVLKCNRHFFSSCQARIKYDYDSSLGCYFLAQCQNEHYHNIKKDDTKPKRDKKYKRVLFTKQQLEEKQREYEENSIDNFAHLRKVIKKGFSVQKKKQLKQ